MDFRFTTEQSTTRADEIIDYIRGPRLWVPRLDYPDFDRWLEKVHEELKTETKRALLALSANQVIGAIIYQRHRQLPEVVEIKNLTVRPDMRGRCVASFLIRNAEVEGCRDFTAHRVVVDTKARNLAMRSFLFHCGYTPQQIIDLYGLGAGQDVVYEKMVK